MGDNSYSDTDGYDGKCGYSCGPEYSSGELEKLGISSKIKKSCSLVIKPSWLLTDYITYTAVLVDIVL